MPPVGFEPKISAGERPQTYATLKLNLKTVYTEMRRLTTGIRSEKCVVRRFRRYANVYLHKPR